MTELLNVTIKPVISAYLLPVRLSPGSAAWKMRGLRNPGRGNTVSRFVMDDDTDCGNPMPLRHNAAATFFQSPGGTRNTERNQDRLRPHDGI